MIPYNVDLLGFDTETFLISAQDIVPRLVCATFDKGPWDTLTGPETDRWILTNADPLLVEHLDEMFQEVLAHRLHLIIQEASFDTTVVLRYASDVMQGLQVGNASTADCLYGRVWEVLEDSLEVEETGGFPFIHDTIIREKLWNLSTHGGIEAYRGRDLKYSLADLVMLHFQKDIGAGKLSTDSSGRIYDHTGKDITGTPEAGAAWRLRYSELDRIPVDQWPVEAVDYALSDATWARDVFVAQEKDRQPRGYGSMNSQALQVYAATALRLYTVTGFTVDRQRVDKVNNTIEEVINKVTDALVLNGIKRKDGSVNVKFLQERVKNAWVVKGQYPVLTEKGKISAAADVMEALQGVDPILDLYIEHQSVAKLRSSFMPNLAGKKVFGNYDILKETGRTSSYGNSDKAKRKPLYEAVNIQQIPRKFGIRECYLPPEPCPEAPHGYVIVSADYESLELCSIGQVTYQLLGHSVHREMRNKGYDLHSYLGASMAMQLAPRLVDYATNREDSYQTFYRKFKYKVVEGDLSAETLQSIAWKDETKKWRNLSKPTGLGYPGGLGPSTQVTFAATTYGVKMTEQEAYQFRELWRGTYPEMPEAFNWVNDQVDHSRPGESLYCYETQGLNRFRAGASFCATANGKFMQSLSADGAKRSTAWLARACFGGAPKDSIFRLLSGCLPLAFIHDENLVAIPYDELFTERALLVCRLMIQAMEVSMPDVYINVEPAAMRRWTKKADPEWKTDPDREAALTSYLGTDLYAELKQELGPTYQPDQRLLPWDDVHPID